MSKARKEALHSGSGENNKDWVVMGEEEEQYSLIRGDDEGEEW